jgi:hypothetical protein
VRHLSEGESGTSETSRIAITFKDPKVEMEEIGMDFIVGLPCTQAEYDSIWVIVDCLTKVAHFIPVKATYFGAKLVELYMSRIVCLHGVPKKIVSERGSQFTSKFWEKLHDSMDTKLILDQHIIRRRMSKWRGLIKS